ncbi:hypothetical protein L2E82_11237 [Cichorium intybus]|uniref:Uncharacterized protein n=1 Tax=Cichorium intybus TaxID=13427 RepID=A0ACB9GDG8_CICIN|nr:hypothetical protein L2E82_11237 [Cichorium intybus]
MAELTLETFVLAALRREMEVHGVDFHRLEDESFTNISVDARRFFFAPFVGPAVRIYCDTLKDTNNTWVAGGRTTFLANANQYESVFNRELTPDATHSVNPENQPAVRLLNPENRLTGHILNTAGDNLDEEFFDAVAGPNQPRDQAGQRVEDPRTQEEEVVDRNTSLFMKQLNKKSNTLQWEFS